MTVTPRLVILSGGAESVSIALAEWAWRRRHPYAVVSLVARSVLKNAAGCVHFSSLMSRGLGPEQASERLLDMLSCLRRSCSQGLVVFPTEDDGLRLLNILGGRLNGIAEFSRARVLRMGGLDKAELFQRLEAAGLGHLAAPTVVLDSPRDLDKAVERFGKSLVIKPAFKPWQRNLGPAGLKVITRRYDTQSLSEIRAELISAWHLCERWVAQPRLLPFVDGERSACVVRSPGQELELGGCEVVERLKYPRAGGSAVWVGASRCRDTLPLAAAIAGAVDLRGVCEMSFLRDEQGRARLLELNTRPWLQIELVEKSGYPIISETIRALDGLPLIESGEQIEEREWMHIERLLLSLVSGDCGSRLEVGSRLMRSVGKRTIFAVYSSRLPGVRMRWTIRGMGKALSVFKKRG